MRKYIAYVLLLIGTILVSPGIYMGIMAATNIIFGTAFDVTLDDVFVGYGLFMVGSIWLAGAVSLFEDF